MFSKVSSLRVREKQALFSCVSNGQGLPVPLGATPLLSFLMASKNEIRGARAIGQQVEHSPCIRLTWV